MDWKKNKFRRLLTYSFIGVVIGFVFLIRYVYQQQILQAYEKETNIYIQNNRDGLKIVFSKIFDEAEKCSTKECYQKITNEINKTISPDLKNFNSVYFIRLKFLNNQSVIEELVSGSVGNQTTDAGITPNIVPVVKILQGRIAHPIFWKDDLSSYQGKEVVIPVKIDGKVIGAIVRQVK